MRRVMNVDHVGAIRIIAKDYVAKDPVLMDRQVEEIRELMAQRHSISPPEENDFRIVTASSIRMLAERMAGKFSILLISLCVVTLLVGGLVLMNILLISVAERTNEIGLRRAMGATRGDIFAQFLTESLVVTFLGMALGSLLGWGISVLLPRVSRILQLHGWLEETIPAELSWQPFALSVVFALLVGTCFGVLPARRAARLHPVDALR
jgi:putative ABC transport system permease protein